MNKITSAIFCLALVWCVVSDCSAQIGFSIPPHVAPSPVSGVEYFFGSDPGTGNGTFVTALQGNTVQMQPAVSLNGLPDGSHKLSFRARNTQGSWSHTQQSYLNIYSLMASLPAAAVPASLVFAEYFTDTDPGMGNGIPLTLNNTGTVSNIPLTVNLAGLSNGVHYLFVRAKDNNNRWGQTTAGKFSILVMNLASLPAHPATDSVRKIEYYFNHDPGFGNGTIITVPATQDLQQFNFAANISGLPDGTHTFYIRTLEKRSMTQATTFYKGTPLAIHWLECTARFVADDVALDWKVQQDADCHNYVIERSSNGTHFEPIDSVAAMQGQSGKTMVYHYRDHQPLAGKSYYRIRQQSVDGREDYSMILGVVDEKNDVAFTINNPVSNSLVIRYAKKPEEKGVFSITSMSGARLQQFHADGNREQHIEVSGLAPGLYILHYRDAARSSSVKFLKG